MKKPYRPVSSWVALLERLPEDAALYMARLGILSYRRSPKRSRHRNRRAPR